MRSGPAESTSTTPSASSPPQSATCSPDHNPGGSQPCATLNYRSPTTPPGRRQRNSQTPAGARARPQPARTAGMAEPIALTPIGVVRGGRSQVTEDHRGAVVSRLVLDPAVLGRAATDGLSEFSHIEVVFHFHQETRVAAEPGGAFSRVPPDATAFTHRGAEAMLVAGMLLPADPA